MESAARLQDDGPLRSTVFHAGNDRGPGDRKRLEIVTSSDLPVTDSLGKGTDEGVVSVHVLCYLLGVDDGFGDRRTLDNGFREDDGVLDRRITERDVVHDEHASSNEQLSTVDEGATY